MIKFLVCHFRIHYLFNINFGPQWTPLKCLVYFNCCTRCLQISILNWCMAHKYPFWTALVLRYSFSASMWMSILDSAVQFYNFSDCLILYLLTSGLHSALCPCVLLCTFALSRLFKGIPTEWNIAGFQSTFLLLDKCVNL